MSKVVLNPKHFHVRTKPEDGTIWLTHEKYMHPIRPIKDVTNEILFCLCSDLNADGVTQIVERSIKFSDGFSCKVTVEVVKDESQSAPLAMG